MPVESTPTLRPPPATGIAPIPALERTDVAPGVVVEPHLRARWDAVEAVARRARAAAQEAAAAEADLGAGNGVDPQALEAELASRRAAIAVEVEGRRRGRDAAVDQARTEAAALIAAAHDDARRMVDGARQQLDHSVAAFGAAPPGPSASAFATPIAMPSSAPAASVPPPMVAAPGNGPVGATYTSVLVQAADGSLQQALVLTSEVGAVAAPPTATVAAVAAPVAAPPAPPAPPTYAAAPPPPPPPPAPAPAHAYPVAVAPAAPAPPPYPVARGPQSTRTIRRLFHLDVILPLIAIAIVLVVLLAWLG